MGRCHHAKARLLGRLPRMWGCSSDGRALQSHCRGQEFDPPQLHHARRHDLTAPCSGATACATAPDFTVFYGARRCLTWHCNGVAAGAGLYAEMCTGCHLGPGVKPPELSQGLYLPAPEQAVASKRSAAQQFWVIKHGVKRSAMPAGMGIGPGLHFLAAVGLGRRREERAKVHLAHMPVRAAFSMRRRAGDALALGSAGQVVVAATLAAVGPQRDVGALGDGGRFLPGGVAHLLRADAQPSSHWPTLRQKGPASGNPSK